MTNFYEPKKIFGQDIKVAEDKGEYTIYSYKDCSGIGTMKIYHVFPGIQVIFNDFSMESCFREVKNNEEIVSINYCLKGRFECEFSDNSFVYIGEGDLAVNPLNNIVISSSFPTKQYRGITVLLHKSLVEKNMKFKFQEYSIDFQKVLNKILNKKCLIMRANEHALHIFSELYSACNIDSLRKSYFKLKVLELMLFFCIDNDIIVDERRKMYTKEQIQIVKHIKIHLEEDASKRITIDQLAKEHGIAKTTLKACFKDIYGISPYAYIKKYRMDIAAKMLEDREKNVTEIAMFLGYRNVSKFSKAFKDVLRYSPKEYQKRTNAHLEQKNGFME
ncbi:helix-turn-helix domain-containing protein [Clostridium sporogenes]